MSLADLRWRLRNAGGLLIALVVLTTVFFLPAVRAPGRVHAWLFVVDVSESMNVRDARLDDEAVSRLTAARAAIDAGLRRMPCGSHAALGLFAGTEVLMLFEALEVCAHYPAMHEVVDRLSWRAAWIGDSRVQQGFAAAVEEARRRRLDLAFVTDGDEAPRLTAPRLSELVPLRGKFRGVVLGVGDTAPQPVPRLDADDQVAGYWQPADAVREGFHPNLSGDDTDLAGGGVDEHLSALRPAYLRELAAAAGIRYRRVAGPADAVDELTDADYARRRWAPRDLRWIGGLLVAGMLVGGTLRRRPGGRR